MNAGQQPITAVKDEKAMKNSVQGLRVPNGRNGLLSGHSDGHAKPTIAFEGDAGREPRKTTQKLAKRGSYLPPQEQLEMRLRQANGDSMRKIAREMDRDWTTVARVLKSEEAQAEVERLRCGLIGLGDVILQSIYRAIVLEDDATKAFQVAERLGIIPVAPLGNEGTKLEGEQLIDAYRQRALMQLASVAIERHRIYGSTPPMGRQEFEKLVGPPPPGTEPLIRDVEQKKEYDPLITEDIFADDDDDKPESK